MDVKKQDKFNGFSLNTLDFLKNLKANNNKLWFESHKQEYHKYLLEPLQNLVMELGEFMLTIDPYFEISPKINKTISRIYRDTRFSRDKSLFRSNMWITFKRPTKDWKDAPAYFFEIFSDWYRYGMGFYSASKATMDGFREKVDNAPEEFLKVISFYSEHQIFELQGEKYKRILDANKPEKILDWYQRKNFYLVCNREIDDTLFSKDLIADLAFSFGLLAPLYHFIWESKFTETG